MIGVLAEQLEQRIEGFDPIEKEKTLVALIEKVKMVS
jgi:hypothetical protein